MRPACGARSARTPPSTEACRGAAAQVSVLAASVSCPNRRAICTAGKAARDGRRSGALSAYILSADWRGQCGPAVASAASAKGLHLVHFWRAAAKASVYVELDTS
jgi:hypothetical protein